MSKYWEVGVKTSVVVGDSKMIDKRENRWNSKAEAIAGIPVDSYYRPDGSFVPGRVLGQRIPILENGRTVLYWWEENLSDAGFVPFFGKLATKEYVDSKVTELQAGIDGLDTRVDALEAQVGTGVIHVHGNETKYDQLNFADSSPIIPNAITDNQAVALGQIWTLPNDIRFQRIMKEIPTIQKTVGGAGKVMEFLRIVPTNNYCFSHVYITANGCVKVYDFLTGYDALSSSEWSKLVPTYIYKDRDYVDFELEIKKVAGFGPLTSGVEMRFHQTQGSTTTVTIKVDFALELPWWVGGIDQFVVLNNQYDFSGSTPLYGKKLTLSGDGKNWYDTDGAFFLKSNGSEWTTVMAQLALKADKSYVDAGFLQINEDIQYIEEELLPLKQDKTTSLLLYNELLTRIEFLQTQIDNIPTEFELTKEVVDKLPLVTNQEELDAIPEGEPYRSQGFIKYKVEDSTFGYEFDDTFGEGMEGGTEEEYFGIYDETFDFPFEL